MNTSSTTTFRAHLPRPPLSRFVECLWAVTGTADHKRERVLPNGAVEVIINLGSYHKVLARDDYSREQLFKHSWVAGIQKRHLVIESLCENDLIGIRFRPGGAYALLGIPMNELSDQVIELELIQKQRFADLHEQLLEADSAEARFALEICRFQSALRQIESVPQPDWTSVALDCGYYDQPHLIHEFRRLSGLTPGEYIAARLPNFNHVVVA